MGTRVILRIIIICVLREDKRVYCYFVIFTSYTSAHHTLQVNIFNQRPGMLTTLPFLRPLLWNHGRSTGNSRCCKPVLSRPVWVCSAWPKEGCKALLCGQGRVCPLPLFSDSILVSQVSVLLYLLSAFILQQQQQLHNIVAVHHRLSCTGALSFYRGYNITLYPFLLSITLLLDKAAI